MIASNRGDAVLVGFVFADESARRLRPAVVIRSPASHHARREVRVAAIAGDARRRLQGGHALRHWKEAGMQFPSVVTGMVRVRAERVIR